MFRSGSGRRFARRSLWRRGIPGARPDPARYQRASTRGALRPLRKRPAWHSGPASNLFRRGVRQDAGWITDNVSWRWIFYVNLPLGILALFVVWSTLHLVREERAKRVVIDWWGAATLTPAVVAAEVHLTGLVTAGLFLTAAAATPALLPSHQRDHAGA